MSTTVLPLLPPYAYGMPPKYDTWYPSQWQAVQDALDVRTRFIGECVPTGGGKSLIAILLAKLSGMRTVYLTATKALQDQVLRDFYTVDVTDMRGQMNYPCLEVGGLMVNEGPCHIGYACPVKQGGCRYYDQLKWAAGGEIVVTNYAYYMTQLSQPEPPLGHFDLMIWDEGHLGADVITSFLIFAVSTKDCRSLGIPWPSPTPQTILGWKTWAVSVLPNVVVQGRTYSNDM